MRTQTTTRRIHKLGSINEYQLEILGNMMLFLKALRVVNDYHIVSKRYYDTITSFRNSSPGLTVDSKWSLLYEVEKIVIDTK